MVGIELMPDFVCGNPKTIKCAKVPGFVAATKYRFSSRTTGACDEDQAHIESFLANKLVGNNNVFVGRFTTS